MKVNNKKTKTLLIILYILFLSLVVFAYIMFTNAFFDSFAKDYATNNQQLYSDTLADFIKDEQISFNSDKKGLFEFEEGLIVDGTIIHTVILENSLTKEIEIDVLLNNSFLSQYNLAIKGGYLFLLKDQDYRVIKVLDILSKIMPNSTANTIMIMDNTGSIYYNKNDDSYILNNYLEGNTTTYINDFFSKNIDGVIKDKSNGNSIYLSFATLKNYDDLYLMESYLQTDIASKYGQYDVIFIIGLIVHTIVLIALQIYIFRSIHIENAEIESSKIRYLYSKPYILKISFKGNIRRINRKMINEIDRIRQYKNVNEFDTSDLKEKEVMLQVKREKAFTTTLGNKTIRFIPLKYSMGYHLVGEDITNKDDNIEVMRKLAYYDRVTKLPNYSYFVHQLRKDILDSSFNYKKTAAVILDVKDFDFMNKIFGRQTSDTILEHIGLFVKEQTSGQDINVYNAYQDKFLLVFNNMKDEKDVTTFMNDLYLTLTKPLKVEENLINVDFSVGIYYFEEVDVTPEAITRIYESLLVALEKAKDTKVSTYIIYDDTLKRYVSKRDEMAVDLVKAIKKEEIVVYLQPQYDNRKQKIVGFEALARWDNPKYINSSPQEFITMAERQNLIIDIGNLVMKQTFAVAKKLEKYNLCISLNVSPVQILQDGFVTELLTLYNSYHLKPGSIAVEITETFLITSLRKVNAKLRILKANGIGIHLDDFGTGYSSLPYLRELEIDTIKIDRAFVQYLETDKQDREIVRMLITLVKNLNFNVIAEGIEDEYQNNYLYKNGCDVIQGFILSKAVPYEQALVLLEDYNINKTKNLKVEKKKRGRL